MNRINDNTILGLIVGDALGCPVEYESREWLSPSPIDGMRAHGTHDQPAGTWTDDSQMMLATLDSICDLNRIDPQDIMDRLLLWYDNAAYTPYGVRFDIGVSIEATFLAYRSGVPLDLCGGHGERDNGNAALSRSVPVALFLLRQEKAGLINTKEAIRQLDGVTGITHAHRRSLLASGLLYFFIKHLSDSTKQLSYCLQSGMDEAYAYFGEQDPTDELELVHFSRFRDMEEFKETPVEKISSTGYVVDTLEAALWSLLTTDSYRDAVLRAVNLGGDTDSIGAMTGALAGLYYGEHAIPAEWKNVIARREWIEELCSRADNLPIDKMPSEAQPGAEEPPEIRKAGPTIPRKSKRKRKKTVDKPESDDHELQLAKSVRERLEEEIRLLRAKIEQLTAERDDLIYRECRELQAEYNRKIGGLEQEAMEAEMRVRALKRMIELMQAQLNHAEDPDVEEAKKRTDEEYKKYEEELKKRAERIRREEEHARRREEQERKSRAQYERTQSAGYDLALKDKDAENTSGDQNAEQDKKPGDQETLEQELKRLYRKIVKKLHPDMNPDITEDEKEMFRRAVEAYGLGDIETLREIAVHMDDEEWLANGGKEELSIERLMEMRERLREQMERLIEEIRRIKMSFPYSAKSFLRDSVKVRAKQEDLKKYIADCEEVIATLRERIAKMQEESGKNRRRKNERHNR
ncbi:MAG: ADP-ribosylglycohydrolase family protein [Lachnospiraceae bacterium]|nr:ADP-ribosylglycohydrolase family protein [Lachnospiraceae bacterium]